MRMSVRKVEGVLFLLGGYLRGRWGGSAQVVRGCLQVVKVLTS